MAVIVKKRQRRLSRKWVMRHHRLKLMAAIISIYNFAMLAAGQVELITVLRVLIPFMLADELMEDRMRGKARPSVLTIVAAIGLLLVWLAPKEFPGV